MLVSLIIVNRECQQLYCQEVKKIIQDSTKKKVTGIGGIFFKCKEPNKMKEWYNKNLGLVTNEYGSMFEFRESDNPNKKGYLQWSPFSEKTKYFNPSEKDFMINYRVENLEELIEELRKSGITILDSIEIYEYGKFIHILDPEKNKIELWEPIDNVFTRQYEGKTTK
jgi:predicted enzyme related to lactoylglutathione lyase